MLVLLGFVPGDFLTSEQWHEPMARYIFALVEKPGGVLLISVEVAPERRHYPLVSFAVFDAQERKALRAAFLKAEEAQSCAVTYDARKARFVTAYRSHTILVPGECSNPALRKNGPIS
jgi:hypothetical protein